MSFIYNHMTITRIYMVKQVFLTCFPISMKRNVNKVYKHLMTLEQYLNSVEEYM